MIARRDLSPDVDVSDYHEDGYSMNLENVSIDFDDYLSKRSSFLATRDCQELERQLLNLHLNPLYSGNIISRYESNLNVNLIPAYKKWVEDIHMQCSNFYQKKLRSETYLFKYIEGQEVPLHVDKTRHHVIAMIYMGVFNGGDYYYIKNSDEIKIELSRGDLLLSINRNHSGNVVNYPHRISEITHGNRFVLVLSIVE